MRPTGTKPPGFGRRAGVFWSDASSHILGAPTLSTQPFGAYRFPRPPPGVVGSIIAEILSPVGTGFGTMVKVVQLLFGILYITKDALWGGLKDPQKTNRVLSGVAAILCNEFRTGK